MNLNEKYIHTLADKFLSAEATPSEEQQLKEYLLHAENLAPDLQPIAVMLGAFEQMKSAAPQTYAPVLPLHRTSAWRRWKVAVTATAVAAMTVAGVFTLVRSVTQPRIYCYIDGRAVTDIDVARQQLSYLEPLDGLAQSVELLDCLIENAKSLNAMKKISISLLFLAVLLVSALSATAQTVREGEPVKVEGATVVETAATPVSATPATAVEPSAAQKSDTLARFGTADNQIILRHNRDGNMSFIVGGFDIALAAKNKQQIASQRADMEKRRKGYVSVLGGWKFGFNILTAPDYSKYTAEQHGFLDMNVGKSIQFGFNVATANVYLNKCRSLTFVGGVGFTFNNYTFEDNISIKKVQGGKIEPFDLDKEYKKSKMLLSYMNIPIGLKITPVKHLSIIPNVSMDVLIGSHTKFKKPKNKEYLGGVNPIGISAGLVVQYRSIGVYGQYGLLPLLGNNSAKTHSASVGIIFGF